MVVESALRLRLEQLPLEVRLLLHELPPTLVVYTDEGTMVKEEVTVRRDDAINQNKMVFVFVFVDDRVGMFVKMSTGCCTKEGCCR